MGTRQPIGHGGTTTHSRQEKHGLRTVSDLAEYVSAITDEEGFGAWVLVI